MTTADTLRNYSQVNAKTFHWRSVNIWPDIIFVPSSKKTLPGEWNVYVVLCRHITSPQWGNELMAQRIIISSSIITYIVCWFLDARIFETSKGTIDHYCCMHLHNLHVSTSFNFAGNYFCDPSSMTSHVSGDLNYWLKRTRLSLVLAVLKHNTTENGKWCFNKTIGQLDYSCKKQ